jgi:hypothetical protein
MKMSKTEWIGLLTEIVGVLAFLSVCYAATIIFAR